MVKAPKKNKRVGKNKKKKPGSIGRKIFRVVMLLTLMLILVCVAGAGVAYYYYLDVTKNLPRISTLSDYSPPVISTVYSDDDRKIAEFFDERRIVVPLEKMPGGLIQAFVAAEDSRFYEHKGIDIRGIIRAFIKNIEAGYVVQGGSTITQQVTKSFLLTPERRYERKLKEAILAYRIDKKFTKDQVLFLYLNQIYLGHGAYGVAAAAENYFGKPVESLTLAESAMLAGLPRAPSQYSPYRHFEKARERQIYALRRMVEEKYITQEQMDAALKMPLEIKPRRNLYLEGVPWYTEHVRQVVEKKYGRDTLYKEGLRIYTAVNIDMQMAARKAVDKGLRELDKRQGYRGPVKHLDPEQIEPFSKELEEKMGKTDTPPEPGALLTGVVIKVDDKNKKTIVRMGKFKGVIKVADMKWARKPNPKVKYKNAPKVSRPGEALNVGDVIQVRVKPEKKKKDTKKRKKKKKARDKSEKLLPLALEQTPIAQSGIICMEAGTGLVKAMVGGLDFRQSQFNRAIQSRRQPGSAFKAIIYSAALDKNYTPASELIDNAFVYRSRKGAWKPKNYDRKFTGYVLLREALAKSRNLATINVLEDIGLDYAMGYAKKLGITSELNPDLSTALGSSGSSLLEMTRAYSVFANLGKLMEPLFITRILDRNGKEIFRAEPNGKQVIEPNTAYIMTSLLKSVVTDGTGKRVLKLGREAAGKTGTTNNLHDAWFMGYTPRYVTGTWVGFDEERSLGSGETGSQAASPIWLYFMQEILEGKPEKEFQMPGKVVFANIDAKTGLLATPESEVTLFECFKEDTEPREYSRQSSKIMDSDQFFKDDI